MVYFDYESTIVSSGGEVISDRLLASPLNAQKELHNRNLRLASSNLENKIGQIKQYQRSISGESRLREHEPSNNASSDSSG